jgi:hypothetical protein
MGTVQAIGRGEFVGLVDELEDLERIRTGSGNLERDAAVRRTHVERRIMELLGASLDATERRGALRVTCDLAVQVRGGDKRAPGRVRDIGAGGAFVETGLGVDPGELIDVEIIRPKGSLTYGFHLKGTIAWAGGSGVGVRFAADDEGSERRLRRFVIEILRGRLGQLE